MIEIKCRCGNTSKRFKNDIGPFFVNECCTKNGFDDLGRPVQNQVQEVKSDSVPVAAPKPPGKPGRGRLRDMRVEQLKAMAREKSIEGADAMTKDQLIAAILQ